MHCKRIRILLSSYLDRATNPDESSLVEQHLKVCDDCRNELADIRRLCSYLRSLEQPRVPNALWMHIRKRLQQKRLI